MVFGRSIGHSTRVWRHFDPPKEGFFGWFLALSNRLAAQSLSLGEIANFYPYSRGQTPVRVEMKYHDTKMVGVFYV